MEYEERIMSLSVLQMTVGVYVMAGIISDGEALRIGLVIRDSMGRAQREKAEALRAIAAPEVGP